MKQWNQKSVACFNDLSNETTAMPFEQNRDILLKRRIRKNYYVISGRSWTKILFRNKRPIAVWEGWKN
jgi:hypothetical protein